ncbi:hypothetical protein C1J03_18090 [Sulfitobacter sp. SK012]|uniref:hypothetical protein n=1 Tax=Sulfitobacter sp. SK012 TaxID=1389005 RepID=UPI000E0B7D30|nr:hypothetical protein [Sulfitobacter sp. SK012]AXI47746.1 hypothetical protein C1J03_18090 [Sulfitobacter sp. SK012]
MRSDWILDVLADLRAFAMSNDLPALAEQLDDTAIVALGEIAALEERTAVQTNGNTSTGRTDFGDIGAGGRA